MQAVLGVAVGRGVGVRVGCGFGVGVRVGRGVGVGSTRVAVAVGSDVAVVVGVAVGSGVIVNVGCGVGAGVPRVPIGPQEIGPSSARHMTIPIFISSAL